MTGRMEGEGMSRVLIVDDEAMIRAVIREYADFEGYEVREAGNGAEAIEWCRREDFDVIVMDLMMPGIDGFTTYESIKKFKDIPVLVLSARGEEYDKLYGFKLGIDDYVVKPFSPKELMARLAVIISRHQKMQRQQGPEPEAEQPLTCGHLQIHPKQYLALLDGVPIERMTRKEFELLYFMACHPRTVFTRDQLMNQIWGFDYAGDGRTVDTHIKMLRHKLGTYRDYIVTARGVGYKFDASNDGE